MTNYPKSFEDFTASAAENGSSLTRAPACLLWIDVNNYAVSAEAPEWTYVDFTQFGTTLPACLLIDLRYRFLLSKKCLGTPGSPPPTATSSPSGTGSGKPQICSKSLQASVIPSPASLTKTKRGRATKPNSLNLLAGTTRLELATSGVTERCPISASALKTHGCHKYLSLNCPKLPLLKDYPLPNPRTFPQDPPPQEVP